MAVCNICEHNRYTFQHFIRVLYQLKLCPSYWSRMLYRVTH